MNQKVQENIKKELRNRSSDKRKKINQRYFKTTDERFGVGDVFMGVSMPDIRSIANEFISADASTVKNLLHSRIHEERMCALVILVVQMKGAIRDGDHNRQKEIFDLYLKEREHVNNWDLVDVSAHYIVGNWILKNPQDAQVLYDLARSEVIWDRRIAMVSQWIMIREDVYEHVLPLAEMFLGDDEDLMHKAVGWMLREYWKRDSACIEKFIWDHYTEIPRTTLRYVIVRMDRGKRGMFLEGDKNNLT